MNKERFTMAFLDKLGDMARSLGDKATDAIETTELNNKIGAEKTAMAECMRQVGEYYYGKYLAGESDDPGAAELFAAIDGHNKAIADAQAEIARIQAENETLVAQAAAPVTTEAAASAAGEIVCPICGKPNSAGTKFCAECGGKFEASAAPESRACPGCGAQVPFTSKFCNECGHKFE
jgi:DNA-directed RNA polymerase subunit RPC12/RpoP